MHARQMGPRQCRAGTSEGSHEAMKPSREIERGQESMIGRECPTTR